MIKALTYKQALDAIHAHGRFAGQPTLERIRLLLHALGDPQDRLKFVHIAGTNGKGSTAAMIAAVLQQAGYKTGLYLSPYLVDFRERIQINGEMIGKDELSICVDTVLNAEKGICFTDAKNTAEFEFITAIALLYYAQMHCDIVVLEAGLGGRFDATNIIKSPEICVITSISYDHMAVLGNTLEQIAAEKAGILKPGCQAVSCAAQPQEALRIIQKHSFSGVLQPDIRALTLEKSDLYGSDIKYFSQPYHIPLCGAHQIDNCLTALEALHCLQKRGWDIPQEAIFKGVAQAKHPGRWEVLSKQPLFIVDGAHNKGGLDALCACIDQYLFDQKIILIVGMSADKSVFDSLSKLAQRAEIILTVASDNERALNSNSLYQLFVTLHAKCIDCKTLENAMCKAKTLYTSKHAVLLTGSLYLVGEAKKSCVLDKI